MYQVVELGIGLNKEARIGRGLMAEDEGQFGTVHLGLGEGRTFGLDVRAPSHVDLVVRYPTVTIDGRRVLADEQLTADFPKT
jgi:leucyl aminopeptidase (aminopeptidase T)